MIITTMPVKGLLMFKLVLGGVSRRLTFVLHAGRPSVKRLPSLVSTIYDPNGVLAWYYRRLNLWIFNITYEYIHHGL